MTDELARLRGELDACSACMKRADAEIEQLRGLLRELLSFDVFDVLSEEEQNLLRRIREALGE